MSARIKLSAYGGALGATLIWRRAGKLWLTTIVKTQLSLVNDELAVPKGGGEIAPFDRMDAGGRTLELASDLAPALPVAEIILAGHACSPADRPVTSLSVRLFVGREDKPLIDKTVHVYGDRASPTAYPLPFQRVPMVYERAVGGPTTDNPVGRPLNDGAIPPNVVNPLDPWVVAGFGAIAPSWPPRQRLARGQPVMRAGILEIPEEVSLDFFHAAPKDQRVAAIQGDEWIVIDGMHPHLPRFQSQLPGLRVRARIAPRQDASAATEPIEMRIARLWIDMDRGVVDVTWRGTVPLVESALDAVQVLAGIDKSDAADALAGAHETLMMESQLQTSDAQPVPWPKPAGVVPPPAPVLFGPPPPHAAVSTSPGLPFATTGQVQRSVAAPDLPFAAMSDPPSSETPITRPHPVDPASDVTITSLDDAMLAALPFARGDAGARRPPQPVHAPKLSEDESEDTIAGLTAVTPAASFTASTGLPFGARPAAQRVGAAGSGASLLAQPPVAPAVEGAPAGPVALSRFGPSAVGGAAGLFALPFSRPASAAPGDGDDPPAAPAAATPVPGTPTPPPPLVVLGSALRRPPQIATVEMVATAADEENGPETGAPITIEPLTQDVPGTEAVELEQTSPDDVVGPARAEAAPAPAAVSPAPRPPAASPPQARLESGIRKIVLDKVHAREAMHGMDLSSVDLSGLDLSGAVLSDAKLTGAKLIKTVLRSARLTGVRLVGADLRGADLTDVDLSRADLTRATVADATLDGADLGDANASLLQGTGASLRNVRAERANFVQAQLDRAVFDGAALRDADFSGASLAGASFKSAIAPTARFVDVRGEGVSFAAAQLDGAIFTGASLTDAVFTGAEGARTNWERTELDRSSFDRAKLRDSIFARASLEVASFLGADLTKTDLSNVAADGADFSEATLTGADMRMSKLSDARLENAIMREANAQKLIGNGARLEGADLSRASLRGARLKGCDIARTKLEGTDLRDADLEGAKFEGVDVSKAKLAGANLKGAEGL